MKKLTKKKLVKFLVGLALAVVVLVGQWVYRQLMSPPMPEFSLEGVPAYSGEPYVVINQGNPYFEDGDMTTDSYETYGELDDLGRCTVTMACIGRDIMPTEERGSISSVKPTGWVQNFYDHVDGEALYNRAHLIGFQLTGENANKQNLIKLARTNTCASQSFLSNNNASLDSLCDQRFQFSSRDLTLKLNRLTFIVINIKDFKNSSILAT